MIVVMILALALWMGVAAPLALVIGRGVHLADAHREDEAVLRQMLGAPVDQEPEPARR